MTNEELVVLAQQGCEESFNQLFKQMYRFIELRAIELCRTSKVYNSDDVIGMFHEPFMNAVKNYDPSKNVKFVTVLYRYFTNKYNQEYDKEKRRWGILDNAYLSDPVNTVKGVLTLGDSLRDVSIDSSSLFLAPYYEAINRVLATLPPKYTTVVQLYLLEGKVQREVQELTGIRTSTVSFMAQRFRTLLREELLSVGLWEGGAV